MRGPVSEVCCEEKPTSQVPSAGALHVSDSGIESSHARASRLLELRNAIEAGTYKLGAEAVANKVMKRMRSQVAPRDAVLRGETVSDLRAVVGRSTVAARRKTDSSIP